MTFLELKGKIGENVFTFLDVLKFFPNENPQTIKVQLSRFLKRGLISSFKREWYCFNPNLIDPLELAGRIYKPSYVSLETALNFYGLIPDVPQAVTSVTTTTTKKFKNIFGVFYYTKISPDLFFGFTKVKSSVSGAFYNLAKKEKALLDYFYLRKTRSLSDLRLNIEGIGLNLYKRYARDFPSWIPKL